MSAACRRFPTPSTTPSRSSAPPTSRCRTTTGATGGRRRIWAGSRNDVYREEIAQAWAASGYIADGELSTAVSLMQLLRRPLLLEGEAGVGKTEVAKALAAAHATELIRLQCYEGLDQSAALYEWNYQRQLLSIQAHRGDNPDAVEDQIFSEKYLLERPLLAAIRRAKPPVLLIDEHDRGGDG